MEAITAKDMATEIMAHVPTNVIQHDTMVSIPESIDYCNLACNHPTSLEALS